MMPTSNLLIYLMRRDLRLDDNPIFQELTQQKSAPFTHLLPVYVFAAQQVEVSGFIPRDDGQSCPYPEARSEVGGFWRCGPHRAKFLAESVWGLKEALEEVGSGLELRVGMVGDVIRGLLEGFSKGPRDGIKVGAVWMASEEGVEEKMEEMDVNKACEEADVPFKLWTDEKYFVDDRDLPFKRPTELPDVFTTYRKMVEPLRDAPRAVLPTPTRSSLPPLPPTRHVPPQQGPFKIPSSYTALESAFLSPVADITLPNSPRMPLNAKSAHPFQGGARSGHERISHLITSGSVTAYKATRNGLVGTDYSTKLSAWLALGCVTARQVHHALLQFEDGKGPLGQDVEGYGKGENDGTKAVRFELLWRDYMRLCTRKFGHKLFRITGFREASYPWKSPSQSSEMLRVLERVLEGTTGMGLIDASQRELYLTGYTGNRARQNVASFLAKHLQLDWRLGAEWYECMLVDYDVSSNWGNWQYVSGVGNDPRGEARVFNPVKQAWDYDPNAAYIRTWIPELGSVSDPGECFQAWTMGAERRQQLGLMGREWVEQPLKKIHFVMGPGRHGGGGGGGRGGGDGQGNGGGRSYRGGATRGGRGGQGSGRGNSRGWHGGSGGGGRYGGSSRPHGGGGGGGGGGGSGSRGRSGRGGPAQTPTQGGAEARTGPMQKDAATRQGYDDNTPA